jgi:hypothetical protein
MFCNKILIRELLLHGEYEVKNANYERQLNFDDIIILNSQINLTKEYLFKIDLQFHLNYDKNIENFISDLFKTDEIKNQNYDNKNSETNSENFIVIKNSILDVDDKYFNLKLILVSNILKYNLLKTKKYFYENFKKTIFTILFIKFIYLMKTHFYFKW